MALSIPTLAGLIKDEIESCYGTPDDNARLQCFCTAIATAIVNHIKDDAVVLPTALKDSFNGDVTGTGTII